jgi:hypothetical protein
VSARIARHCQVEPNEGGEGRRDARVGRSGPSHGRTPAKGDVLPDDVTLGVDLSTGGGRQSVTTPAEVVANGAERPKETLCVLCRFESLDYALASRQVRILSPVVQTLVAAMLGMRQNLSDGRWITGELGRDHDARLAVLAFEHLTQEPLGNLLIAPLLDQDVSTTPC